MKKFLIKCIFFTIPVVVFYGVIYNLGYYPIISDSISFDAKIFEIKRSDLKQVDVIAIGSSVCLNNFSSDVVTDSLTRSYYNFSVWGLQIGDWNHLIKSYVSVYDPKYVLLVSDFADFELPVTNTLPDNLPLILNCMPYYYIKNYVNFNDIEFRKNEIKEQSSNEDRFNYLGFDKYGGVAIRISDKTRKKVIAGRLSAINFLINSFPNKYSPGSYKSLDSLALFLQTKKVKLIFIQTPFADECLATTQKQIAIAAHFKKCEAIVKSRGGVYLNFEAPHQYPDSLFADPLHLNAKGSVFFTKKTVGELKKIISN